MCMTTNSIVTSVHYYSHHKVVWSMQLMVDNNFTTSQISGENPVFVLRFALKQTVRLPGVCLEDALVNAKQFRACRVPFATCTCMGTQSFDEDNWMPHLQHCMVMMSLSVCRQELERACVCFYLL